MEHSEHENKGRNICNGFKRQEVLVEIRDMYIDVVGRNTERRRDGLGKRSEKLTVPNAITPALRDGGRRVTSSRPAFST